MREEQRGFSLVELLVVVGIILIVAAIAIPNFMRERMVANESSAVASLRSINTAEMSYATTYPNVGFAPLGNLGGTATDCAVGPSAANGCFLDNVLATNGNGGGKNGYNFAVGVSGNPGVSYTSHAEPLSASTGSRAFCGDESGVIYFLAPNSCTPATGSPIQ